MKKYVTLALMALLTLSVNAKKVNTSRFSTVKVDAPVRLVIEKGNRYAVNVLSHDRELATAISWEVKDGVLHLSTRDFDSLDRAGSIVNVIVTVPTDVDYEIGRGLSEVPSSKGMHR